MYVLGRCVPTEYMVAWVLVQHCTCMMPLSPLGVEGGGCGVCGHLFVNLAVVHLSNTPFVRMPSMPHARVLSCILDVRHSVAPDEYPICTPFRRPRGPGTPAGASHPSPLPLAPPSPTPSDCLSSPKPLPHLCGFHKNRCHFSGSA